MCSTEDFFCLAWLLFLILSLCVLSPLLEFSFLVLPFPCLRSCDFRSCDLRSCDFFYGHFLFAILLVALFLLTMNDIFLLTLFFDALAYRVALVTTILERKKERRRNISNCFKVSFKKSAKKVLVSKFTKYGLHRGCFPKKIPNLSKYLFSRTHKNSCSWRQQTKLYLK